MRPLLLVTRPEPDGAASAGRLEALGFDTVLCPLSGWRGIGAPLPGPERYAALALTSANGLRALEARGETGRYRHLPLYAVGTRTARLAAELGFAEVYDAKGALGDLVALLAGAGIGGRVLHPAGRHRAGDLASAAGAHGVMVETVAIYEMAAVEALGEPARAGLVSGAIEGALFYSRRAAEIFVACLGEAIEDEALARQIGARLAVLCLAEAVAEPLRAAGFARVLVAERPDEDAMMALASAFARGQNRA